MSGGNSIPSSSAILGAAESADPEYDGMDAADLPAYNIGRSLAGFVYWSDWDSDLIQRSRLDGSATETVVDLKAVFGGLNSNYEPRGVAVDVRGGKVYWTDRAAGRVQRSNLNGSNVQTLVSGLDNGLSGIAIDSVAGKIYWTTYVGQKIQRANLDGTGLQDLVVGSLSGVRDIALDIAAGKMYWVDLNENNVRRANLDGSAIEVLWTGTEPTNPGSLTLDVPEGKMYWSDISTDKVFRANLNGTNVEQILDLSTLSESTVAGLVVDSRAGKLYWTDNKTNAVHRANLDGSNPVPVTAGFMNPHGVALALPGVSVTPQAGLVTSESGGTASFQVILSAPPTANVTVPLSSSDVTEGSVAPASLVFTPSNWNVPQTVVVTGVNDVIYDGSIAYTIVTGAAASADANYQGWNAADVAVTNTDNDPPPVQLYFSLESAATLSAIAVANEDIVAFSGSAFSLLFDGSDVGLANLAIDAFTLLGPTQIALSFTEAATISGVSGTVDDSDLVLFTATSLGATTAGTFSWYFDASDVGLTTNDEDIDAVELLPDGSLLVSTLGPFSVTGISGEDADLARFVPSALGATTSGTWSMYFDASDVGLSTANEDVDAVARDASGKLYFSTTGNYSVTGSSGADEDVFTFQPTALGAATSGTFGSSLFFDGSAWGLSGNDIVAIDLPAPAGFSQRNWTPTAVSAARPATAERRNVALDALFRAYGLEQLSTPFRSMRTRANRSAGHQ